jgi:hypothetical protein
MPYVASHEAAVTYSHADNFGCIGLSWNLVILLIR